jgi:hypothetical protein
VLCTLPQLCCVLSPVVLCTLLQLCCVLSSVVLCTLLSCVVYSLSCVVYSLQLCCVLSQLCCVLSSVVLCTLLSCVVYSPSVVLCTLLSCVVYSPEEASQLHSCPCKGKCVPSVHSLVLVLQAYCPHRDNYVKKYASYSAWSFYPPRYRYLR